MSRRVPSLAVLVIGCGTVGREAIAELRRLDVVVVAVDRSAERLAQLPQGDPQLHLLEGDAFLPEVLERAGLATARALISTLQDTRDALFLAVMARHRRPDLRIVTRVATAADARKFRPLQATTVEPAQIGGTSLARLIIHPELAHFAQAVIASADRPEILRVIPIRRGAPAAGLRLADADLQLRTHCVILGIRSAAQGPFRYSPPGDTRLRPGGALVALGSEDHLAQLVALVGHPT